MVVEAVSAIITLTTAIGIQTLIVLIQVPAHMTRIHTPILVHTHIHTRDLVPEAEVEAIVGIATTITITITIMKGNIIHITMITTTTIIMITVIMITAIMIMATTTPVTAIKIPEGSTMETVGIDD